MNEYTLFPLFGDDFEQTYQLQHEVQNVTICRSIKLQITVSVLALNKITLSQIFKTLWCSKYISIQVTCTHAMHIEI